MPLNCLCLPATMCTWYFSISPVGPCFSFSTSVHGVTSSLLGQSTVSRVQRFLSWPISYSSAFCQTFVFGPWSTLSIEHGSVPMAPMSTNSGGSSYKYTLVSLSNSELPSSWSTELHTHATLALRGGCPSFMHLYALGGFLLACHPQPYSSSLSRLASAILGSRSPQMREMELSLMALNQVSPLRDFQVAEYVFVEH